MAANRGAGRAADRSASLAGDGEPFPGAGGATAPPRQNVDLIAVLKLGRNGALAIDAAADAAIADIGMHGVGEVDHVGLARQRDELALGREAEHLIVEQLKLGVFEKLFGLSLSDRISTGWRSQR